MKIDWKAILSAFQAEAIVIAKSPEAIKLAVLAVQASGRALEAASVKSPLLVTAEQLIVNTLTTKLESLK